MSRILMLTHEFQPFPAGIARYAAELATAAHRLGHEITVIAPTYGNRALAEADRKFPFTVERVSGGIFKTINLLPLLVRTNSWVRRQPWDIIHAVDWPYLLALRTLNRFRPTPFVATIYGTELLSLRNSRLLALFGAGDMFRRPERLFVISEFTRTILQDVVPDVDAGCVVTTPLGVAPFWFGTATDEEIRAVRERFGIVAGKRIILTAARLDPRKGQDRVVDALTLLPSALKSEITYIIAGSIADRAYSDALRRLAADCGVQVIFAGVVSEVELRALYATAHVFAMPGEPHGRKVEGFGLAYLEGAAQGCPSIACRVAAVPEVVRDNETGLLVPPQDTKALADALNHLLEDRQLRQSLGEAARAWAHQFTWERCAQLTYGPAAAEGGRGARTELKTAGKTR